MFSVGSGVLFAIIFIAALPERRADNVEIATLAPYAILMGALAGAIVYPLQYWFLRNTRLPQAFLINVVIVSASILITTTYLGARYGLGFSFISVLFVDIFLMFQLRAE